MTVLMNLLYSRVPDVLMALNRNGPQNAMALGQGLGLDNSFVLKLLKRLSVKGYVVREGRNEWRLTDNGRLTAIGFENLNFLLEAAGCT